MENIKEIKAMLKKLNALFDEFKLPYYPITAVDTKLGQIIQSELSGVLNWALDGLGSMLKNRQSPDSNEGLNDSDIALDFLNESNYVASEKHSTSFQKLFDEYILYCDRSGIQVDYRLKKSTFGKRLESYGYIKVHKNDGIHFNMVANDYINEPDTALNFLTESKYAASKKHSTSFQKLFDEYILHCVRSGIQVNYRLKKSPFGKRLEGYGYIKVHKNDGIHFNIVIGV